MPTDPNASAITPALLQTSAPPSIRLSSLFSVEWHGIGQSGQHLRDTWIVLRAAVDVAVDALQPPPELGAGDAAGRLGRVDEEVHLGRGALTRERHQVAE